MPQRFDPRNWYWFVGGDTSKVYSSARAAYVFPDDAEYSAWLSSGLSTTSINSISDLYDVLLAQWLPIVASGGVQITSTGTPAINGTYRIDASSIANIVALSTGIAAGKPLPGGGTTFNYPDSTNVMHSFTAENFLNFAAAIETFIYTLQQNLLIIISGGSASLPVPSLTVA